MAHARDRSFPRRKIAEERAFPLVLNRLRGVVVPQAFCDYSVRS